MPRNGVFAGVYFRFAGSGRMNTRTHQLGLWVRIQHELPVDKRILQVPPRVFMMWEAEAGDLSICVVSVNEKDSLCVCRWVKGNQEENADPIRLFADPEAVEGQQLYQTPFKTPTRVVPVFQGL